MESTKNVPAPVEGVRSRLDAAFSTAAGRLIPMEGLRGFAVLLVFLVHYHTLFGNFLRSGSALNVSQFTHAIGNTGVDIFFVLSGFLIYGHLLRKDLGFGPFLKRRIRRIYPTFLAVLAIYVVLSHVVVSASKMPPTWKGELVYVAENFFLLPGIFDIPPLISVSWSLSYEFFFYLSIPIIVNAGGLRKWRPPMRCALFLGLFVLHALGYALGLLPHIRLSMFLGGMLLFEIVDGGWVRGRLSQRGEWVVITGYLCVLGILGWRNLTNNALANNQGTPLTYTGLLFLALPAVVLYALVFQGLLNRIFTAKPMRWVGNMSYSYFLIHGLVLNGAAIAARKILGDAILPIPIYLLLMAFNLVSTLIVGLVLYLAVEWPLSLRHLSPPRAANALTAP